MTLARDNPFRVECLHALAYEFENGGSVASLLLRFEELGQRGAIVGPHGTGKTTLVQELIQEWQRRGESVQEIRLSASKRASAFRQVQKFVQEAPREAILILDGAEQLNWWQWRRFVRQSSSHAGLLITTHRPGRLTTLHETRPPAASLQSLVDQLVTDTHDGWGEDLPVLFEQHRGNIRDCLRELYERSSTKTLPGPAQGTGG